MDDVIAALIAFNEPLLPEMVEAKYLAMEENLFRFFRATAHLFFSDWCKVADRVPAPPAWICGDLHLENFGSFKAQNRQVYFDLNDFDEAILAPAHWEVVRAVCSIFAAFKTLSIDEDKAVRMAELYLRSYSSTLACGKASYIEARTASGIVASFLRSVEKRKDIELLSKKTTLTGKHPVFRLPHHKHRELAKDEKKELHSHIEEWIRTNNDGPYNYHVLDSVFRVAGTGSMGLKRYAILLKSKNKKEKYLLLDMKQVRSSSLLPYVNIPQPAFESDASRVTSIQRMMQNVPPALLSYISFRDDLFLVQEMQPVEDNINFKLIRNRYRDMYRVIDDMGMLTASAQLRSSGRKGSATADELIAFGNDHSWHSFMIEYAATYTGRIDGYYDAFLSWRKNASVK